MFVCTSSLGLDRTKKRQRHPTAPSETKSKPVKSRGQFKALLLVWRIIAVRDKHRQTGRKTGRQAGRQKNRQTGRGPRRNQSGIFTLISASVSVLHYYTNVKHIFTRKSAQGRHSSFSPPFYISRFPLHCMLHRGTRGPGLRVLLL